MSVLYYGVEGYDTVVIGVWVDGYKIIKYQNNVYKLIDVDGRNIMSFYAGSIVDGYDVKKLRMSEWVGI